jgi:hypothetical protein
MRVAFEAGDRSEARSGHEVMERQSKALATRDKELEKQLKGRSWEATFSALQGSHTETPHYSRQRRRWTDSHPAASPAGVVGGGPSAGAGSSGSMEAANAGPGPSVLLENTGQ